MVIMNHGEHGSYKYSNVQVNDRQVYDNFSDDGKTKMPLLKIWSPLYT